MNGMKIVFGGWIIAICLIGHYCDYRWGQAEKEVVSLKQQLAAAKQSEPYVNPADIDVIADEAKHGKAITTIMDGAKLIPIPMATGSDRLDFIPNAKPGSACFKYE